MSDAGLEARLRAVEDRLEILQLLAAYGPAVDAGAAAAAARLWRQDGSYDTFPEPLIGSAAVAAMVEGELHQSFVRDGCAHLQGLPHVVVEGDRAVATFHSLLLLRDPERDGFRVWRASANRCELVREAAGWRIERRVNRVLDGGEEGRALLRRGVEAGAAADRARHP